MTGLGAELKAGTVPNGGATRSRSQALVLTVAVALGVYLCYRLATPFLSAIAWALTLAVVFAPAHRWLEARLKRRNVAAAVSVLGVGLIVVVPLVFVGKQIVVEAAKSAQFVAAKVESGDWRRPLETRPRTARLADRIERHVDLPGTVQTLAEWLTHVAKSVVNGSVVQAVVFLLTFYLLFFFLRDRRVAIQSLRSLSPLSEVEMDRLLDRVGDTVYATVCGTVAVAAVQGLLGGLMFWWLGLPAPLLWGVVMALLAVVPVLGAFVIWVPTALFLVAEGSWGKALILTVWGGAVVGTIDNLLRPFLVGRRLKLHTVLAFMSVIGGLVVFGASGLILGPVVLTVTMELLDMVLPGTSTDDFVCAGVPAPLEKCGQLRDPRP